MKKCCLCCLQTLSSPKNEFNSIPYASCDATGTVHVIPLCLHKSFRCIEGIISTWKMALLWIIRTSDSTYTRMITSFWVTTWFYQTIYGATPSDQGRQSYHPLFILSIMMRPTSRLLSLILMIWKRDKYTAPVKNRTCFLKTLLQKCLRCFTLTAYDKVSCTNIEF